MDKFVGKRLDGRYEIKEIIGVGGMAVVYKAYDSIEDRIVAIKILKEEFASNEEFQRRFKNESKAIAVLSHPNIVKVFDVSFGDLIQYIVMEYIDGITLKEYIERNGVLPWSDAVNISIQILRGLQHAHDKGIVHRDVKPQNIMILADNTVKVTDFGIARFARNESKTITDKAIGSVHYISPEQVKGELTDEKADIYSVGVIMYEMITGTLPFEAESAISVAMMQLQAEPKLPTHLNPLIPLGLEQITMKAMQKDAANRYKTAAEMLHDLEQFKRDPEMTFKPTYFVDDSPTRHIGSLNYNLPEEAEPDAEDDQTPQKAPIVPILTGVAVAFVAAVIVLGLIFIPRLFGKTSGEFDCPNYIGQNYETVTKGENKENFEFEIEWVENDAPANQIVDQTPKDRKVKSGATVKLKVSKGPAVVVVPVVANYDATKAKAVLEASGMAAVADDSGLMVDALGGAPGVHSARYGGLHTDRERLELLLQNMEGKSNRNAHFVSVITLLLPDGRKIVARGECPGQILTAPQGENGFGYDPVFYVPEEDCTFAQMPAEVKNRISHRARALELLAKKIREEQWDADE